MLTKKRSKLKQKSSAEKRRRVYGMTPYIYDGAFVAKIVDIQKLLAIFAKRLHHRLLKRQGPKYTYGNPLS